MVLRRALSYWRHCARPRRLSTLSGLPPAVALSASVTDALLSRAPVVALETAIVTHGLPFPEALDAQLRAEAAVRNAGAIPASVGVLDGRIKVGLEAHELERLADPSKRPKSAIKAARRDLAFAVHSRLCAGTTVSATSHVASLVGIRVFATGGIGGAAPDPRYDISEDLLALEDTPVAVVCAGVKSIMDVAATLEHLETLGVPVATVSESGGSVPFPTFYTRDGPPSPLSLDPAELAGYLHAHFLLRPRTGALIAVPIPAEFEADGRLAQAAIDAARREAKERGITGKAWTPFVLDRVRVATKGASVVANIGLYLNNARTAASLAVSLASHDHPLRHPADLLPTDNPDGLPLLETPEGVNILPESEPTPSSDSLPEPSSPPAHARNRPIIIGGTVLDITARLLPSPFSALGTSTPGHVRQTSGGVARNVAEACHRLGGEPVLCSVVGDDVAGRALLGRLRASGMSVEAVGTVGSPTAIYSCILDAQGGLLAGVADMRALDGLTADRIGAWLDRHLAGGEEGTPAVLADGNVTADGLREVAARCKAAGVPFVFEPTSSAKSVRIVEALAPHARPTPDLSDIADLVTVITPNGDELDAIHGAAVQAGLIPDGKDVLSRATSQDRVAEVLAKVDILRDDASLLPKLAALMLLFPHIVLTLGPRGVLLAQRDPPRGDHDNRGCTCCFSLSGGERMRFKHLPPKHISPVSVTGAGDTLAGALVAAMARGMWPARADDAVVAGMRAAEMSAGSEMAVAEGIGRGLLEEVETTGGEDDDRDWG